MMLKLKIYSTVFVLYEILAVLLLHCPYTCTAMFGTSFCSDSVFKYFIALFAIPAIVGLIVMWIMHIIHALRRRHSFLYRAQEAVEDVAGSIKKTLKESVSSKDIEKYIVAALAAGVKKYSDKNPELKKSFGRIVGAIASGVGADLGFDADDEEDKDDTKRRSTSRRNGNTARGNSRTQRSR